MQFVTDDRYEAAYLDESVVSTDGAVIAHMMPVVGWATVSFKEYGAAPRITEIVAVVHGSGDDSDLRSVDYEFGNKFLGLKLKSEPVWEWNKAAKEALVAVKASPALRNKYER